MNIIKKIKRLDYYKIAVYAVLILISYQFLYPLLRMFSLILMSEEDIINPAVNWIPGSLTFGNLHTALRVMDLRVTMWNSIWFSGVLAIGQTFVSAATGYALARYDFPFKRFWFAMIIITFILPTPVLLIPRTMMVLSAQDALSFSLIGSIWPQVSMAAFGQGVFSAILILIFYNFTMIIPPALDEAAEIDGAGPIQVFYHIILKLSVQTILVVFLFSFVWNWNETYVTSTFLRQGLTLVPARLEAFEGLFSQFAERSGLVHGPGAEMSPEVARINEAFRMAGTLLAILPLMALYLAVQKHFIKGIENTGLTGI